MLSGRIEIESIENQFTRVSLTFPASEVAEQTTVERVKTDLTLADRHLLIIDDDTAVREATRILFEGIGCKVSVAANTADAVAHVQQSTPDIALVDLRLPAGESGLTTITKMRELVPQLPVIIVSGESSPTVLKSLKLSGHPYLSKPIDKAELIEEISALLTTS